MHAESGSHYNRTLLTLLRPHLADHFPASPLTAVISVDQPIYILGGQSYSNSCRHDGR